MSRWIRWKGLIAFLVITAVLLAFFLFFVDDITQRLIEKAGTALVGARVELDEADVSLLPLGLRLSRLQVTNPDDPMTNAVEIGQMAFSMDSLNLLRQKVIIREMSAEKIRLNTPRHTSGALSEPPEKPARPDEKSLLEKLPLPSLDLPDVREILEKEDLQTLKLARSVREEIEAEREKWKKQIEELPGKAKLEEYRERIKKMKSSRKGGVEGILGGAAEFASLQKDLKVDLDRIQGAKASVKNEIAGLQKRLEAVSRAPLEDARRLREKYALSPQGLSNLSRMLLGQQIGHWTQTALDWYQRLKPGLDRRAKEDVSVKKPLRGKGMDVHFKEKNPVPDFLIQAAQVSVEIPAGVLAGQAKNITPDQDITGAPITLNLSGEKLRDIRSITLDGEFNRVNPARPRDRARLQLSGYHIQDFPLSRSSDFPVTLSRGLADLQAQATIENEALEAKVTAGLKSVELSPRLSQDAKPLVKVMASTLSHVKEFHFQAEMKGTVKDYDLHLTSDLDQVLGAAIGKQVREQAERFEARLRAAISEKAGQELGDLKARLGGLEGLADELSARLKLGGGLLKEALEGGKGGLKLPF